MKASAPCQESHLVSPPFYILGQLLRPCPVSHSQVWTENFRTIYDLQALGQAFESPEEMLGAMGVFHLTQKKASDHMKVH